MRPTTSPAATAALSALIAALPIERLAALVLEIANGSTTPAIAPPQGEDDPKPATRRQRRGGWRGRRRGPRKATLAAAAKAEAKAAKAAARAALKRQRRAEARAQREVAQQAETVTPANGASSPGNGAHSTKKTEAARLWEHAAKMDAKWPWRVVANEFDFNKQQTLDAYRQHTLPPGMTPDAIERFLELPVS